MMALYFKEQDIDEFRECFYLYARNGQIRTLEELKIILRSLDLSPTTTELNKYFKDKNGKLSFADFLDIMHKHTRVENIPKEILDAFRAYDVSGRGIISARELKRILSTWGEKMTPREVDQIFREANISPHGSIRFEDFVRIVAAPIPDYY